MRYDERKVVELALDDILPNRFQPRITFGEDAINELAESIKEHGVIQPIVVRKINDKYEIIAGERRYKASTIALKETIPAIITDLNDKESAEIALIENVQREDLTPIEEAVSYKKILDMGYLTQEDLSSKLGKKQSTISNKLRLLNLDEEVQEALLEKQISERHARSLLRLNTKDQKQMLSRIVKERLTVRKTDSEIDDILAVNNKIGSEVSNEIEKLEIFDEIDVKEKGDKSMNNNFNIPVEPIIEENNSDGIEASQPNILVDATNPFVVANNKEESLIPPASNHIEVEPETSPGFMDIEKIEHEATDINVEKPVANMNNLLEPTKAPEEVPVPPVDASIFGFTPAPPVENNEQNEKELNDILKPGKFFDLNGVGEVEGVAAPATPKVEPLEMPETPVSEVKSENTSSMFGINLEPKHPEFVGNVEAVETNMDFGIPKPALVTDTDNLNFDSFFNKQAETPEIKTDEPVSSVLEESVPFFSQPTVPAKPAPEPVAVNVTSEEPVKPVSEVVKEQPLPPTPKPAYEVPSALELDDFLSSIDSTTPISAPVAEATIDEPVVEVSTSPTKNIQSQMDEVVTIIHECKNKLENLGLIVDIDEFDFDDMYQAIIKIDK